jgi:hypothetical protein
MVNVTSSEGYCPASDALPYGQAVFGSNACSTIISSYLWDLARANIDSWVYKDITVNGTLTSTSSWSSEM